MSNIVAVSDEGTGRTVELYALTVSRMMSARKRVMAHVKRALAVGLLLSGVILVFAGLNAAVGLSLIGVVSTAAAIAALLYSGAVWFAAPPPRDPPSLDSVVVYDQSLRVASGNRRGEALTACLPAAVRVAVEARCLQALAGNSARFSCGEGSTRLEFDAVPVRGADGMIVYGLLITEPKSARSAINAAGV